MTEYLIGKRERMSWVIETGDYGSGGTMTNGEVIGINTSLRPNFNLSWQEILTAGADTRTLQGRAKGKKLLPFNIEFSPVNWVWLKYLMDVADGTDGATVKTHTFTVGNTVNTFELEWAKRHTTNVVYDLVGGVMKSASLSWTKPSGEGTQGFVRVNANCIAQDVTSGSTVTTLDNIDSLPFQFRMVKVIINGVEVKEINNGEMTLDCGIDENDSIYANSTFDDKIGEPIPKLFRISGRFNINVKDGSLFDLWNAGTSVSGACSLLFDRDGTGNDQILFTFNNFYVLTPIDSTNLEGVNSIDLAWSADSFTSVVARDLITTY